jgi:hypothetical protein
MEEAPMVMRIRVRSGIAATTAARALLTVDGAGARASGIQRTPDDERILVSKDVADQRYAITANTAGEPDPGFAKIVGLRSGGGTAR